VGLGRGQALPDRLCVLFCFRVPACGFCLQVQSRSRGVKESRSRGVGNPTVDPISGLSLGRRWAIPGLSDSPISLPGNPATEPGGTTPKKHKNNTNEASMLLKTQGAFGKRTQNELKNEPNLGCLRREPNSEVARLDGKKPLTWLATLATLPREEGAEEVWSGTPKQAMRQIQKSGEQSENVYENKGQVQKVAGPYSAGRNADRTSSGRRSEGGD